MPLKLVAALAGLVIVATIATVIFAGRASESDPARSVQVAAAGLPSTDGADGESGSPDPGLSRLALINDLYALGQRSAHGRARTIAHDWDAAARNRRSIVRELDAIDARTTDVPGLRAAFRRAMVAAARANEQTIACGDGAVGRCSAPYHKRAHQLKDQFRARFLPYEREAGLTPLAEAEF